MEQHIELIVSGYSLLTCLVGVFILLETPVQIGLAFSMTEGVRGLVLLGNSCIGFTLQLAASLKEGVKLMELITHPSGVRASCLIARNKANATIRGHADAVKAVVGQVC